MTRFVNLLVALVLLSVPFSISAQVVDFDQRKRVIIGDMDISKYPKYDIITTSTRTSGEYGKVSMEKFKQLTKPSFFGKKPVVRLSTDELCKRIDRPTANWLEMGYKLKYYVTIDKITYVTEVDLANKIKPFEEIGPLASCTIDEAAQLVVITIFFVPNYQSH